MSYGKVYDAYWDGEKIEPLSDRACLLGLYLITGPHRNAIGCFKLGVGAIMDLPRFHEWGIEGVSEALREMEETGFIVRDWRTGWTYICNALAKDPVLSFKSAIHAAALAAKVPANTVVYQRLRENLEPQLIPHVEKLSGKEGWPMREPIEGASKGHNKPLRSPLPLPEPLPPPESGGGGSASPSVAPAVEIIAAFDEARAQTWGEGRRRPWPDSRDKIDADRWLAAGADPELCRKVFATGMAKLKADGREPPSMLRYFDRPVAEAIAAKPLTATTPGKGFGSGDAETDFDPAQIEREMFGNADQNEPGIVSREASCSDRGCEHHPNDPDCDLNLPQFLRTEAAE